MLEILGITATEESVYTTLLDNPPMTLAHMARACGLDRITEVETALAALEDKGLVSRLLETPPRYTPTSPEVALESLLLTHEERLHKSRAAINELAQRFRQVPRQGSARDAVEIVVGETAVTRRIDVSLRSARTECRVLDRPPYREVVTAVPDVERDLLSRGVRVRTVYDQSAVEAVGLHHLREAGTLGERSRLVGRLRIRLFLVDDRLALLPLKAGVHPHDGMLLVHPSALLDALSEMFELVWERAVPLELESGADTDGGAGDADESALLGLLAAGLTDGAIARQLGLSIRTVERRISKIMTRLQARTRFQAGIMLGQNRKST